MAKFTPDAVLDKLLDDVATSTRQSVCSAQPANYAGIAAVLLASSTLTGGSFTKADDTSGRKVTVAAQTGVTVSTGGTATHVVLDDGTLLKEVTTCTSQVLTSGNTINVPAWKVSVADPT